MKKNISINIGGIIFHIEEDGYNQLKNYLDSINRYFSAFEDSQEIVSDIENRIAEIFLAKLKDGKQVITKDDVASLITTMGSIEDFQAMEEETGAFEQEEEKKEPETEETYTSNEEPKRLFRDKKRAIIGGVASGIANYFGIDALWIRLLLILLFLDVFFTHSVSALVFVGYIICWIFLPVSDQVQEDKKVKKLYRDPDKKVIGGVASGLAAYFGVDIALVRIVFLLLLIPAFAGFFIYIILWMITPIAKTVTEKMQMEGTPVTLSNIENNIKSSLNVKEGEENALVKILLFPFRLIAVVLNGLAKALGPLLNFLVEAVRVLAGVLFLLVGLSLCIGLITFIFVAFGIISGSEYFFIHNLPATLIAESIPPVVLIFGLLAGLIPALFITITGISIAAKKWVMNSTVSWSLFAVWIVSLIGGSFLIPRIASDFKSEGYVKEVAFFDTQQKEVMLDVKEAGLEDYDVTDLRLRGYEGDKLKLVKTFESRGNSRMDAELNAGMVTHQVVQQDSIITFDSNIHFKDDAKFRGQSLDMVLYIPYGQPFRMDYKMRYLLTSTIYRNGYSSGQISGNQWVFEESGLKCLTCEEGGDWSNNYSYNFNLDDLDFDFNLDYNEDHDYGSSQRSFDLRDFTSVEAEKGIHLYITQGDDYKVSVQGDDDLLDDVSVEKSGSTLRITQDRSGFRFLEGIKRVKVTITMRDLSELDLESASHAYIDGFETNELEVDLSGASYVKMNIAANQLDIEQSGASKSVIAGSVNKLMAELSSASKMEAFSLLAEQVIIDTESASRAEVNAVRQLKARASSASSIAYKGNPSVDADSSGAGSIKQD